MGAFSAPTPPPPVQRTLPLPTRKCARIREGACVRPLSRAPPCRVRPLSRAPLCTSAERLGTFEAQKASPSLYPETVLLGALQQRGCTSFGHARLVTPHGSVTGGEDVCSHVLTDR